MIDREALGLPVLWETEFEIIVVKPAGMASELTSDPNGVSVIARVRSQVSGAKLPHRLDRVTRGLLVVALTDEAITWHNEQIRESAWEKIYLARVCVRRNLDDLIGEHMLHLRTRQGRAEVVRSGGKRALTETIAWAPAAGRADEAHVLIRLLTGRFHQIRATMAHLGAPLADDWLYGTSPGCERERFYLEHTALRFTPYGEEAPPFGHWRDDPDRESISPSLCGAIDRLLAQWEKDGARPIGGANA